MGRRSWAVVAGLLVTGLTQLGCARLNFDFCSCGKDSDVGASCADKPGGNNHSFPSIQWGAGPFSSESIHSDSKGQ
jgi:hypothetical protein